MDIPDDLCLSFDDFAIEEMVPIPFEVSGGGAEVYNQYLEKEIRIFYRNLLLSNAPTHFFSGLYFDPKAKKNKKLHNKVTKPCVVSYNRDDETIICHPIDAIPDKITEEQMKYGGVKEYVDVPSGRDYDPVHLDCLVGQVPEGRNDLRIRGRFASDHKWTFHDKYTQKYYALSFTRIGRYMYPIADGMGLVWLPQTLSKSSKRLEGRFPDCPGAPFDKNWNVISFTKEPGKIDEKDLVDISKDHDGEYLIVVRTGNGGNSKFRYLSVPNKQNPGRLILTDDARSYFRFGTKGNKMFLVDGQLQ